MRARRARTFCVGLGGLVLSASLLGLGPSGLAAAPPPAGSVSPDWPIEHVVIIYQENHTFDDVLGALCQVRENPCDGYTGPVTFANGITAKNIVQPDIVPAADHSPEAQRFGMRGKWNRIGGCVSPPYSCVSHIDPDHIPNLAALATTFVVSDRTFAAGRASSFGAHVSLGGGTFAGFAGDNPVRSRTGVKPREGWGCRSRRDALWGETNRLTYQPSCIPDRQGRGPYRRSKVPYAPTIMQRIEQAGLSWHIYEGDSNTAPLIGPWSVCTYFAWCWLNRFDLEHDSARSDFLTAAADGTLPSLSIILPTGSTPLGGVSQHNGNSMALGDNYIGGLVGAVMDGPDWESTAVFITYDDCGCFYDHVTPPKRSMGLRNPMVIVSPWAEPKGTDSTNAIQPYSMLAFTQHLFGLRSLSPEVEKAYDYADSFDFTGEPLRGPEMTTQLIPPSEWRRLVRLQRMVENDPT